MQQIRKRLILYQDKFPDGRTWNAMKILPRVKAPKFMVIAGADSRVCPSYIIGFQPGEAFVVRNVANLVPPFENGPTETNAALEFAVNSLEITLEP
ncbi:hypothetical protein LOK49_LG01G01200 [Camellia lanceoleosa]|uniref:Uncharacterized protein n=1 Tax=Camellia lanceoleosa TaxID=1840588 RepID=A0ACC0J2R4_9ERIC|nr:hypothetical protein LOK49_LG01G01200 [Camellia lanceoleosa]